LDRRQKGLPLQQRYLDGAQVLEGEADIQDGDQHDRRGFRPLPERGEAEHAGDHEDVNGPVPLQSRGAFEERLNQLAGAHGASWLEKGHFKQAHRITLWSLPVPATPPPRAVHGKSAWPISWWPAGGCRRAACRW